MSATIVDLPKVAQMLDAGWLVSIGKNPLGSYSVRARHPDLARMRATRRKLEASMSQNTNFLRSSGLTAAEAVEDVDFDDGELLTDDFTPEQALTRMAYKVFGEIL